MIIKVKKFRIVALSKKLIGDTEFKGKVREVMEVSTQPAIMKKLSTKLVQDNMKSKGDFFVEFFSDEGLLACVVTV